MLEGWKGARTRSICCSGLGMCALRAASPFNVLLRIAHIERFQPASTAQQLTHMVRSTGHSFCMKL